MPKRLLYGWAPRLRGPEPWGSSARRRRPQFLRTATAAGRGLNTYRTCRTSARGHHDAVASHDQKVAAVLAAPRKKLLLLFAVIDLFEAGQLLAARTSDDRVGCDSCPSDLLGCRSSGTMCINGVLDEANKLPKCSAAPSTFWRSTTTISGSSWRSARRAWIGCCAAGLASREPVRSRRHRSRSLPGGL